VQAAVDWEADEILVEVNYGGDMAVETIRSAADNMGVPIPIRKLTATRGKAVRAQPVSAMSQQGRWRHAGVFEELEDQMCTWTEDLDWSPDRLDGAVWDAHGLKLAHLTGAGTGALGGGMSRQITNARH
jgi:phage terminase large subunit-like protein